MSGRGGGVMARVDDLREELYAAGYRQAQSDLRDILGDSAVEK